MRRRLVASSEQILDIGPKPIYACPVYATETKLLPEDNTMRPPEQPSDLIGPTRKEPRLLGPGAERIDQLVSDLGPRNDRQTRLGAVQALRELGRDATAAVPALIAALRDEYTWVRFEAAHALREIGPDAKPALPVLLERLENGEEETVRDAVRLAMSAINGW